MSGITTDYKKLLQVVWCSPQQQGNHQYDLSLVHDILHYHNVHDNSVHNDNVQLHMYKYTNTPTIYKVMKNQQRTTISARTYQFSAELTAKHQK